MNVVRTKLAHGDNVFTGFWGSLFQSQTSSISNHYTTPHTLSDGRSQVLSFQETLDTESRINSSPGEKVGPNLNTICFYGLRIGIERECVCLHLVGRNRRSFIFTAGQRSQNGLICPVKRQSRVYKVGVGRH